MKVGWMDERMAAQSILLGIQPLLGTKKQVLNFSKHEACQLELMKSCRSPSVVWRPICRSATISCLFFLQPFTNWLSQILTIPSSKHPSLIGLLALEL